MQDLTENPTKKEDSESFKAIIQGLKGLNFSAVRPSEGLMAPPNSPEPEPEPEPAPAPAAPAAPAQHRSSSLFFGTSDSEEKTNVTRAQKFFHACRKGDFGNVKELLRAGCSVNTKFSETNVDYQGPYQTITPLIAAAMGHHEKNKRVVITILMLEENPEINFIAYPINKFCNHQPVTLLDFVDKKSDLWNHLVDRHQAKTAEELLGKSEMDSYDWRPERH